MDSKMNAIGVQPGGALNIGGRRSLLDRWRANRADPCATVYNQCIDQPLQQQTLVKPLAFQNVCAPQSIVPDVKCKSYFNEGGFITKPVSRTYVLKPTLLTRLKGIASGARRFTRRSNCGTFYTSGTTTGGFTGAQQTMTGGYQLGASNFNANLGATAGLAAPPLHHKEVFDETATIAKPIHRKYVFKPTWWTRAKNLALTGAKGGLKNFASRAFATTAAPAAATAPLRQPGLY